MLLVHFAWQVLGQSDRRREGRHRIDDKWFLDFETHAGGYHGSALGYGAVGYKWSQSFTTSLGYRVFYAYFQGPAEGGAAGSFRFNQTLYGPQFNATYTF